MIPSEIKTFHLTKTLNTYVDVRLFPEAVALFLGDKHQLSPQLFYVATGIFFETPLLTFFKIDHTPVAQFRK